MVNDKKLIYNVMVLLFGLICCSGFSFLMQFRIYFIILFGVIQFFLMIKDNKIRFVKSNNLKFLILFCIYLAVSIYYSLDRIQTCKFLAMYLSILFMIINSYDEKFNLDALKILDIFCKIVAVSIIINVFIPNLYSKYLYFLIDGGRNAVVRLNKEISGHIFSGIVGEKGEAAYLMVLGIILQLSKSVNNKFEKKNFIWLIIFFIALLLPAKRMLFAIAVMITIFFVLFWTKTKKKFLYIFLFVFLSIVGIFVAIKVPALNTLVNRFLNYSGDTTGNGRIYLWERAMDMFHSRPLFGYGYGTYNTYTKFNGVLLSSTGEWNAYAHNIYIQMLGEIGLVGVFIYLIMILDSLIFAFRLFLSKNRLEEKDCQLLFVGISILISNLLYGYSGNPIYYTNQAFVMFWGVAILLYLKYKYRIKVREI